MNDNKIITRETVRKIYAEYFELIDDFFGSIKHHLGEEEDSHIDLGIQMASYPLISDLILDAIDDFSFEIEKFWAEHANTIFDYISAQNTLKCLYSGNISPVILENFVKKSCLYVDSIIIADPAFIVTSMQNEVISDSKYYLNKLVSYIFNLWKLKDLILSEAENDIIFILPISLNLVNPETKKTLLDKGRKDFIDYFEKITGQKGIASDEDAIHYLKGKSIEEIFDIIKDSPLPYFFKEKNNFLSFFSDFNEVSKLLTIDDNSAACGFVTYIFSQFIRTKEHNLFCEKLLAEPIYDFEVPWFFFGYEYGYTGMDSSIATALQKEKFDWISKIPIKALGRLREEGRLDYMRMMMRNGITDLKAKNDSELIKISSQIETNFKEAFEKQKAEISSIEKEVSKILERDIPITTAVNLLGVIPGIGNAVSFASMVRDIDKSLEKTMDLQTIAKNKRGNFINLLIKSYEQD